MLNTTKIQLSTKLYKYCISCNYSIPSDCKNASLVALFFPKNGLYSDFALTSLM
jgi:hypothetical protein